MTSSAPCLAQTTEAYGRPKLSAQPTLTGEVPTNPKVVNSVTDARISKSESIPRATADWHRNADILQSSLARLYATVSSLTENDIQNVLIHPAKVLRLNCSCSLFHDVPLVNVRVNLLTFDRQLCRVASSNTITVWKFEPR